ncbi:amidohydrolase family protein [Amycolatopsis sp. NPDC051372]|uniref:amidohydrolase family protein n=1 Tax=unclassified Amycolatopsis TaxID=2618356 RepID=UPI003441C22A
MSRTDSDEIVPYPVLDTHAHIVPPSLLAALEKAPACGFSARRTEKGWVVDVPGMGETRPIGARMNETGPRAGWRAQTGVATQVISPWMDIQSAFLEPPAARDWARTVNDAMAESVAELGGGTTALASVATDDGEQAAADLLEAWKRPEFTGVMLSTDPLTGSAPHEENFEPLWTVAAREEIPVVLHPPTYGPSGELATLGTMGNVHGRLIDNTVAVTELILHGLLDRHPGLKVILVHGGGFLPYQASRLDGGYRTKEAFAGELEREKPSDYLRDFVYDTVALSAPAIRFLTGLVGSDHVVLGSDYPFALGDPRPVHTVLDAGLSESDTEAILRTNAENIFRRPA